MRAFVDVVGSLLVSVASVAVTWGALGMLGLQDRVREAYPVQMGANAALGIVAGVAILFYATRLGGVPRRAFAFGFGRRDAAFVALSSGVTVVLAAAALGAAAASGTHALRWSGVHAAAWAMGLVGQLGVIHEELTFRGYLLARLRPGLGVGGALLTSAVLFAAVHVPFRGAAPQMLATWILGGLLFGFLYLKSGSLLATLFVHVAHNLTLDVLTYSRAGVSLLMFEPDRLLPLQKAGFEIVWTLAMAGLAWWVYGRGTTLLQPSRRLASWGPAA